MVASVTGVPKRAPPSVDFAIRIRRLPVAGQTTKTSPAPLVFTSQPMAVPDVSEPLICCGASQPEAVRRLTNWG